MKESPQIPYNQPFSLFYSSDLTLCDIWLFDYIKKQLSYHNSVETLDTEISK